jgi:hypothetical protein
MHRNRLATHLRAATHSRSITPRMDKNITPRMSHQMPVPHGPMVPGMGDLGAQSLSIPLGARVPAPKARNITPHMDRSMRIPLDRKVAQPVTNRLPSHGGKFMPGMGDIESMFGDLAGTFMPGMGDDTDLAGHARARAHRAPKLRKVQKPRIMGTPARSRPMAPNSGFMPGFGEEDDGDMVAVGYLTAPELADGDIPANAGAQAAAAGASAMKTLMITAAAVIGVGLLLKMR